MDDSFKELVRDLKPYVFVDKVSHDINWREKNVYIIDSKYELSIASEALLSRKVLYIDCEGEIFGYPRSRIGLVQVAASEEHIFLFDVIKLPKGFNLLGDILKNENIIKVFHDCTGDGAALHSKTKVIAVNAFDTQVAQKIEIICGEYKFISSAETYSLPKLYKEVTGKNFPKINAKRDPDGKWFQRPMSEDRVKYATADVMVLPEIYKAQKEKLTEAGVLLCFLQTWETIRYKLPKHDTAASYYEQHSLSEKQQLSMLSGHQQQQPFSFLGSALAIGAAIVGVVALAIYISNEERR